MGWEKWLLSYHVHLLICSCGSQTFSFQGPPKHKWDHGPQFDWALSQGPPSEKSFTIRSVCLSVCQPISLYCSSCIHYYAIFLRLRFFFNINYKPIKCHNCIFHGCVKLSCWQKSAYRHMARHMNTFWNTSKHFCDHSRTTFSHYDTHTKHTRWSINSWCCHSW